MNPLNNWREKMASCQNPADLVKVCPSLRDEKEITVTNFSKAFIVDCQINDVNDVLKFINAVQRFFPKMDEKEGKAFKVFLQTIVIPITPATAQPFGAEKNDLSRESYLGFIANLDKSYTEFAKLPIQAQLAILIRQVSQGTEKKVMGEIFPILCQLLTWECEVAESLLGLLVGYQKELVQEYKAVKAGGATPNYDKAQSNFLKLMKSIIDFNKDNKIKYAKTIPFFYVVEILWNGATSRTQEQMPEFFSDLKQSLQIWLNHRKMHQALFELIKQYYPCDNPYDKAFNPHFCQGIGLK